MSLAIHEWPHLATSDHLLLTVKNVRAHGQVVDVYGPICKLSLVGSAVSQAYERVSRCVLHIAWLLA